MRVFDTPPPSAKPFSKSLLQRLQVIFLPLSVVLSVAVWAIIGKISGLPAFILPSPGQVWQRFLISLQDGSLLNHAGYTLLEVILGLAIGTVLAAVTGYLLSRSPLVEALVGPYLIASQAIPIAAVAPLLIIWFGTGISTKILICALVVFFPVLVNTALGLRSVPEDMRTLMTTMRATP
ncbi:MAG TPA: ABC transporter permease subunit, partial [Bellilinea sp.]|nr:ABC transporter permease subunit [Bellilinea sp.]